MRSARSSRTRAAVHDQGCEEHPHDRAETHGDAGAGSASAQQRISKKWLRDIRLRWPLAEADRCLQCKKPKCVPGCPVEIDIPGFISALARKDLQESYRILKSANALACGLRPRMSRRKCSVKQPASSATNSNRLPSDASSVLWPILPSAAAGTSPSI